MKYIDEFRDKKLIAEVAGKIKKIPLPGEVNIMEVCGSHTMSFFRFGLHKLLPGDIRLIAGPGCPVCVSTQEYIDSAIGLAQDRRFIITTFGDMLRVPGEKTSLQEERALGADIRVVYSPLSALEIARANPAKKVIFLAVGFETTAPTIALSIIAARKEKLKNLHFLCSLKLIPPAMEYLLQDKRLNLSGFLCPGHVSAIIGSRAYEFIARKYKISCCVAGFEPWDMLEGIYIILRQLTQGSPRVTNQYSRVVTRQGNIKAQKIMAQVFKISDASWRGLGKIKNSGLEIKRGYAEFNAQEIFSLQQTANRKPQTTKCKCGEVLKGLISPEQCPLFAVKCSPDNPVGPCMVSQEGACSAYYKYQR